MGDSNNLLVELLKLANEKEIPYTQAQLKRMNEEQLQKVYSDYQVKQLDDVNEMVADVIIIKFEDLLKASNWIKPTSQLACKLQKRKMFKRDLKNVVSWFTPILPFIGILEGTMVIAADVVENYAETTKNEHEDSTSQTDKGEEQSESKTNVA